MRNNYPLIILGSLVILPAFSLAQIRYQLSHFSADPASIVLLIIISFAVGGVLYIYFSEKKAKQEFDDIYLPVGQKGGRAKMKKQKKSKTKLQ